MQDVVFLASVGLYNGKVFALFVKSPAKVRVPLPSSSLLSLNTPPLKAGPH